MGVSILVVDDEAEFVTKPVDFDILKRQLQQLPIPSPEG